MLISISEIKPFIQNIKGIIHTGGKNWISRWELAQVIALSKSIHSNVYLKRYII